MGTESKRNKIGGFTAQSIIIPFIVLLGLMHVLIIFLIFRIGSTSSGMAQTNRSYAQYRQEAALMLSGSSTLSEAVASLLLRPTDSAGEVNVTPLIIFTQEYADKSKRGSTIAANFETYGLSDSITQSIKTAADAADRLLEADLHAIALFFEAYGRPAVPALADLTVPGLTDEEKKMSVPELMAAAARCANGEDFARDKLAMVESVNKAMGILESEAGQKAGQGNATVGKLQLVIRITTFTIIIFIVVVLSIFYIQLILPMYGIVHNIRTGTIANDKKGLREIRLISAAYNKLINRRANFEDFLRSTNGADIVASLPDRSAFDNYLESDETAPKGKPLSLVLFDISDYETTEKDLGRSAANQLLRTAAECIVKCFGNEKGDNCFVLDRTRFAAVTADTTRSGTEESVEMFAEEQSKWGISIFWGVSYTDSYAVDSLRELIKESERKLYIQKKVMFKES